MITFFSEGSTISLIWQSDFATKCILLVLFGMSVVSIALITFKLLFFRKEQATISEILPALRGAQSIDDFKALEKKYAGTVLGTFLQGALEELTVFSARKSTLNRLALSKEECERFDFVLSELSNQSVLEAEQYLPFLGISAAVSPLIGLFGTVWGLIHAFINISQEKSADLAIVAPGIAEALITTLAGLIVAIPALIFFHYFSNELRKLELYVGQCADRLFAFVCANSGS